MAVCSDKQGREVYKAVADESTAHIAQLVSNQKSKKVKKSDRKLAVRICVRVLPESVMMSCCGMLIYTRNISNYCKFCPHQFCEPGVD